MRDILFFLSITAGNLLHGQENARMMQEGPGEVNGKMMVEIWSDVVCPFCYIGKKEFEAAIAQFPQKDSIEVIWRSFELDPRAPRRSDLDMYGMLVEKYGGTRESAKARVEGVVQRGLTVGIHYNMEKAIIANSFDAHRLIQLAKTKGLADAAEERLFKAYFIDGLHIADNATLEQIGKELGLDGGSVQKMLASDEFAHEVRADERAAHLQGVRGVPYFLIDGKVPVSGAQPSEIFLNALQQAWNDRVRN